MRHRELKTMSSQTKKSYSSPSVKIVETGDGYSLINTSAQAQPLPQNQQ